MVVGLGIGYLLGGFGLSRWEVALLSLGIAAVVAQVAYIAAKHRRSSRSQ